jgi:hypothetical protein
MRHAKGGERFREHGPELLCGEREHGSGAFSTAKSDILKEERPHVVWAEADTLILASLGLGESDGAELGLAGARRGDMVKLDATELTNAEVAVEAKEERDGICTMTMEHPCSGQQ